MITPVPYDGALEEDLIPYNIVEDMEWRNRMERDVGSKDGYNDNYNNDATIVPVSQRKGILWNFAKRLISEGYVVDTKGYSTCFRVNAKQQINRKFNDLVRDISTSISSTSTSSSETNKQIMINNNNNNENNNNNYIPDGLSTSYNLGCLDIYPHTSGKKNCCKYLAKKFCGDYNNGNDISNTLLDRYCVCLCDDDNDMEMALSCRHAYIPSVTSNTMANTIRKVPKQFTVTCHNNDNDKDDSKINNNDNDNTKVQICEGDCQSTENALNQVLQVIKKNNNNKNINSNR